MDILPLPYIERRLEEGFLRAFLRNGLNPTPEHAKALVLCGLEGAGKRTLLRRVFASDPAFRKFSIGAQTHEILQSDGPSVARNARAKAVDLAPGALGLLHPLLGLVAEAARLLGKDYLSRPRGTDLSLDYSILERIDKPILIVVPRIDPSNVDVMEDAARLIREAHVRDTPISLVFLDHFASPCQADASAGERSTTTASDYAAGLRRFLPSDRQVTEVGVRPFAEAQIRQSFARLGLAPDWAALCYHFSEGQPAALAALWESLQRRGLLRRERRWKAEGPAVAGAAWGVVRDRLIDLIRARPAPVRAHEDRLINALHLAAAMGDTFLPVAVSEAVLAADPKRHQVDAEAWEDAWLDFLEFEDADHPVFAAPVTRDGHPIELEADGRRIFVYRFRDPAIIHLLSAALRRFWRGGADAPDGDPAPDPGTLLDAVASLADWLVDHFSGAWRNGLVFRAALHRIQNQHAEARALEELDCLHCLVASLAERIAWERASVHGGKDARELYQFLSWAAETWRNVGDYRQEAECRAECYDLERAGRVSLSKRHQALLWGELGAALWRSGQVVDAMPFLQRALEARERVLGSEHPHTLTSVHDLGVISLARGRLFDAEFYFERALKARERLLGPDHPDTFTSVSNYGTVLGALGRPADAEPYHRRALEGRERVLGPDHPDTLSSHQAFGAVLRKLGRPADAEPYYRRALKARERVLGPDHPDTLSSVNDLGAVLHALGQPANAEPYCRRALEARERVLGPDHPDTLSSVDCLGAVLHALGQPANAEPYCRRALEARERVLGPDHPDTLSSVNNLGTVLHELGRPAEAEPCYRRALEARERVLGPDHPDTLSSVSRLGSVLEALGRHTNAEPYRRRALESRERVLGLEHADTLSSVNSLGLTLFALGRPTDAESYHWRALEARERVLGADHPDTLTSANNLGAVLHALGRPEDALRCFRRASEGSERVLGLEHPHTLNALSNLGAALQALGRSEEALRCFRQAFEWKERVLGPDHPDTQTSKKWIEALLGADDAAGRNRSKEAEALET